MIQDQLDNKDIQLQNAQSDLKQEQARLKQINHGSQNNQEIIKKENQKKQEQLDQALRQVEFLEQQLQNQQNDIN